MSAGTFSRRPELIFLHAVSITQMPPISPFCFLPGPPLCVQGSDPLPGAPVLVLRFSYICPDRQLRRYVVLEPDAHAALQVTASSEAQEAGGRLEGRGPGSVAHSLFRPTLFQELLAVLTPAATTAQRQLGEARDPLRGRLQCLRCGQEFKPEEPRLGLDSEEGWRPLFQETGTRTLPLTFLHTSLPPSPVSETVASRKGMWRGSPREGRSGHQFFCLEEK